MAESKRGEDSANVLFNDKPDTSRKKKRNPYVIIIVKVIVLVVIGYLFYRIGKYADTNNCISEFWDFLSNAGTEIACAAIGLAAVKLSPAKDVKNIRSKRLDKFISGMSHICMFLIGGLCPLCLLTFFHVKGAIAKENEIKLTQYIVTQMNNTQMSSNNERESKKVKEVTIYNINQDLYMENRPLEDYYNGEITAENSKLVKALILYNNMEHNMPNGSVSENYSELLETADYQYETYKFKKGYAVEKKNTSEEWFKDRIESLQESLDAREEAEKEYESPKNERPLATGYRDKGDEYFGKKNQNMAMDAYEQSADWFIKAIYHAAAIEDYEEMNTCMTKFKELGEEVKKLKKADSSRKNKIMESIEVYEKFVELVNESK